MTRSKSLCCLILIGILLLSACCGVGQPEPTQEPSATATRTPAPTDPPPTDTPTSTSTPTPTYTPAPTLTPSPTPTSTPSPTSTPDPMLVQGHVFGDPILVAIADRAPNLTDNFDSGSGWYVGVQIEKPTGKPPGRR